MIKSQTANPSGIFFANRRGGLREDDIAQANQ